jgi:para-nitrobenzyl esterase
MGLKLSAIGAISLAGALLASTSLVSADAMMPLPGDPVATSSGKVSGTRLSSGVKAYLGIPFAKPPTGELRWKPPQPISWDGVWNADRKGPECIQVLRAHDINHYFGEEPTSEDCLYLNLWAPAEAKPGDSRPVIIFIYGGGGTSARRASPITAARTWRGAAPSSSISTIASACSAIWRILS